MAHVCKHYFFSFIHATFPYTQYSLNLVLQQNLTKTTSYEIPHRADSGICNIHNNGNYMFNYAGCCYFQTGHRWPSLCSQGNLRGCRHNISIQWSGWGGAACAAYVSIIEFPVHAIEAYWGMGYSSTPSSIQHQIDVSGQFMSRPLYLRRNISWY